MRYCHLWNLMLERDETKPFYITQLQLDILKLVINGYSTEEIADKLRLTIAQVHYQRIKAMNELEAKNMDDLLDWWYREKHEFYADEPVANKHRLSVQKSKFAPSKVDPNIDVNIDTEQEINIQMALYLLGIDERELFRRKLTKGAEKDARKHASFWNKPPEFLWRMLELAKDRYKYEIQHAHPDRGGDPKRAAQLNTAWDMIKKSFARRGYILPGHEPVGYQRKAPVDKKSRAYKRGWI